jgi:hypothetical protein
MTKAMHEMANPPSEEETLAAIGAAVRGEAGMPNTFPPSADSNLVAVGNVSVAQPEAPRTARDALADRDPLRIWTTKGPKSVGGLIEAWLCQDENEIVLSHTLPSGRFSLFAKVAK